MSVAAAPAGIVAGARLGAGGEAEVFEVVGRRDVVFKRYRHPTPARADKLEVMLRHPPANTGAGAIAWPLEIVRADDGAVLGFLMRRIDLTAAVPVFQLYNPASRVATVPAFSWRYLLRTARNLAAVVDTLHAAGYVVGDLNESNLLVDRRAVVALVDCDSMQVRDPDTGGVHHCTVAKAEFLAPELHGRDLAHVDRGRATDAFSLAVLVHLLLMEGTHPYAGVWRRPGEPPALASRLRARHYPRLPLNRIAPPPAAVPLRAVPWTVRWLFVRAFVLGPLLRFARPSAAQWVAALDRADARVRMCARSPHHQHTGRRCPWCARVDRGLPDPFPGPSGRSPLEPRVPSRLATAAGAVRMRFRALAGAVSRRAWARAQGRPAVVALGASIALALPLVAPVVLALEGGRRRALSRLAVPALVAAAAGAVAAAVTGAAIEVGRCTASGLVAALLVTATPVRLPRPVQRRLSRGPFSRGRASAVAWCAAVGALGAAAWQS